MCIRVTSSHDLRRWLLVSLIAVAAVYADFDFLGARSNDQEPKEHQAKYQCPAADCHIGCSFASVTEPGGATKEPKKNPPTRVLDDPQIQYGKVMFKSGDKEIDGFLARPKKEGKYPVV